MKKPFWVILLTLLAAGIGLAHFGELIPTAHKIDRWAALVESLIVMALGLFGHPVVGRGAAVKFTDEKTPTPPPAALALLVVGALSLSACGDPMTTYYRTVSTTAVGISTGYRSLSQVDKSRLAKVTDTANAGAPGEAQRLLDDWLPKYDKGRKILDAGEATVEGAMAAAPAVELAVDKKKQVMAWVAKLVAFGAEMTRILTEVGAIGSGVP